MTRKKVTLAYISNDANRKSSYNKRKKSFFNKAQELTTLCDIEACAIIYGKDGKEPTEVWPSQDGARQVIEKFQRLSHVDKTKKMVNQEGFSQERIEKTETQLQRLESENRRKEVELYMYQVIVGSARLQDFDMSRAAEMSSIIQQIRLEIKNRVQELEGSDGNPGTSEVAVGLGD